MKTIELNHSIIWSCELNDCWLATWAIGDIGTDYKSGYSIIYPDGRFRDYEGRIVTSQTKLTLSDSHGVNSYGEIVQDLNNCHHIKDNPFNQIYRYEFINHIKNQCLARIFRLEKEQHAVAIINNKNNQEKIISFPINVFNGEKEFSLRWCMSKDGLTILIHQWNNNKVMILDNPLL